MGLKSPPALPGCFPTRLRAILDLRRVTLTRFTRRVLTLIAAAGVQPPNEAYLVRVFAGRQQPTDQILAAIRVPFDADDWAWLTGATDSLNVAKQERLAAEAA